MTFGKRRVAELRKLLAAVDTQIAEAVEEQRREALQRAQTGRKRAEAERYRRTIANAREALAAPEPDRRRQPLEWNEWSFNHLRAPTDIVSAENALAYTLECYPSLAKDAAELAWSVEKRRPAREYWARVYAERAAARVAGDAKPSPTTFP